MPFPDDHVVSPYASIASPDRVERCLAHLARHWNEVCASQGFGARVCILAARYLTHICGATDWLECEVVPVGFVAGNHEYWEHGPGNSDTAYAVAAGLPEHYMDVPGAYNGHVIVVVNGEWWVDLSAGQADRPEHDISIGPLVVSMNPERNPQPELTRPQQKFVASDRWIHASLPHGASYLAWENHDADDYRTTPDWNDDERHLRLIMATPPFQ